MKNVNAALQRRGHKVGIVFSDEHYCGDVHEPLGSRIVTMLDVALRGIGNHWNEVVIPGFDYCVVENTLGKFGPRVERLSKLPVNVQDLVHTSSPPR